MANHSNQGLGIGPSRIGQGMVGLGLCNKCLTQPKKVNIGFTKQIKGNLYQDFNLGLHNCHQLTKNLYHIGDISVFASFNQDPPENVKHIHKGVPLFTNVNQILC